MFLRARGRQILVLQSYRDHQGRIRQRCLGRARDSQGLEEVWKALEVQLKPSGLARLRAKSQELSSQMAARNDEQRRQRKVARHAEALLRLLSREEIEVLELGRLRRQFAPKAHPPTVAPQEHAQMECEHATRRALVLIQQGRLSDSLRVFERLPVSHPWGHLNRAALELRHGDPKRALDSTLRGLARDPAILPALESSDYWKSYSHLWGQEGREFLRKLWGQTLIKIQTARAREGRRPRRLAKNHSQGWLLERLLPRASGAEGG